MNIEYRKELKELYEKTNERTEAVFEKNKNITPSGLDGPMTSELKQITKDWNRGLVELKKKYNIE